MEKRLLWFLLLLWSQDFVICVRLLELRVPAHVAEGKSALLSCDFDMEGDTLYSVKWYKDNREFFRYIPGNIEYPLNFFEVPGVYPDMSRSSHETLRLVNLTRDSSGIYRCEISGEAPTFTTVSDEKSINVQLLPKHGPRIKGIHRSYKINDVISGNCTSFASRPEAQLKWFVNDQLVPSEYLRGPWYRVSYDRPDAYTVTMQLVFIATEQQFLDSTMKLKCQATVAPQYQQESVHTITLDETKTEETTNKASVFGHASLEFFDPIDTDDETNHAAAMDKLTLKLIFICAILRFIV